MNKRLNRVMIEAVENQIREEDPPVVKMAYEILQWSGYSEKQAKEKIAAVLLTEMYDTLKEGKPYQEERYRTNIEDMLAKEQVVEENLYEDETGIWKGLGSKLDQGYRAFEEDGDIGIIMDSWMEAWKQVRRNIREAYNKPEVWEVDEATDYLYSIEEWILDVSTAFFQAEKYQELIQYCQEVIDCFAWEGTAPNEFKALIGEGYYNMGKLEESDRWLSTGTAKPTRY